MTLTEFLLARIAEDEAVARTAAADTDGVGEVRGGRWNVIEIDYEGIHVFSRPSGLDKEGGIGVITAHMQRHDPARVLAECKAKLRIIARHSPSPEEPWESPYCLGCGTAGDTDDPRTDLSIGECPELADLAAVYADHPDFREDWRP